MAEIPETDDMSIDYLNQRKVANRQNSDLADLLRKHSQLIVDRVETPEQKPPEIPEQTPEAQFTDVEALRKQGVSEEEIAKGLGAGGIGEVGIEERKAQLAREGLPKEQIEERFVGLEDPWVDPALAFTGGFGSVGRQLITRGLAGITKGVVRGGVTAAADIPIGVAADTAGEVSPGIELPVAVFAGILSGVAAEQKVEKAVRKFLSKGGAKPTKEAIQKGVQKVMKNLEAGKIDDELSAKVLDELTGPAVSKQISDVFGAEGKKLITKSEDVININLARVNTTEDVKGLFKKIGKYFPEDMEKARRGVQKTKTTRELAELLSMTPETLLARREGQAFNAEEALSARNLLISSGESLMELARNASKLTNPNAGVLDEVAFRKALVVHKAIQEEVTGVTAEAGRALQQFNITAKSTKAQLKQLDDIVSGFGDAGVKTEEMARAILTLDDPTQLNAFVNKVGRATTKDVLFELWINALLSGPQTHAVNTLSNSLVALWQIPERLLASGFSKALKSGDDAVRAGEAKAQAFGIIEGFKDGLKAFGTTVRTGDVSDVVSKVEVPHRRAISAEGLELSGTVGRAADYLGGALRIPTLLLGAEDAFFKSIGYRMELNARAYREAIADGLKGKEAAERIQRIIANPPEDIHMAAIDAARYQTFTQELGFAGKSYQKAAAKIPVLRIITPFIRTPTNIMKFFFERSPVAVLMEPFRAAMKAGGSRRDLALARVSMGAMVMATASVYAADGTITGGGPVDPRLRNALRATGWQPYSVKIGDTYYAYGRLEPLGTLLGIAADFTEISGELGESEINDIASHSAMAVAKNITSKTFLRGISDLLQTIDDPERYGDQWIRNLSGTVIPTGVAQITRIQDPVLRETRTVLDRIRSRVPGYSKDLPPRRNIWGEPIRLEGGLGPDIISPVYIGRDKHDPISDEIVRLEVPVSMPPRQIMGVELSPHEYSRYVELAGNAAKGNQNRGLKDELARLFKSSTYLKQTDGPDGGKALMVRETISAYRGLARNMMIKEFPELEQLVKQKLTEKKELLTPRRGGR